MSFDEFVANALAEVPGQATAAGVDPTEAFDGMVADFMDATLDEQAFAILENEARVDERYHGPARTGIMRVTGMTPDEYEFALANDPVRMARARHDYMATI